MAERIEQLRIENIRGALIRQEETIIFALVERAQFKQNGAVYQAGGIAIPGFDGSFVDYLLRGTEALHATVRRYTSPDEHPFFMGLPPPLLPPLGSTAPIKRNDININGAIKRLYETEIIPAICAAGDDQQYGSSAVCDVACLQALSKRIHHGKFVAESKYLEDPETYKTMCIGKDREGILKKITNRQVEEKLLRRVERKAATYGQEIDEAHRGESEQRAYKIPPALVTDIYRRWIIPMTKEVEVEYLLSRG